MGKKAHDKIAEGLAEALAIVRGETEPARSAAAVELGRLGGHASAKSLSPEQRSESARKAAKARWAKEPK